MKHPCRTPRRRALYYAKGCMVLLAGSLLFGINTPTVEAKDPVTSGDTGQVMDAFVGVLSMAGPEGAAAAIAAKEMKDVMGMLGFFKQSDPIGEALKQINARLDAIETRLDKMDDRIRQIDDRAFRDENLARSRKLGEQRNVIAQVLQMLRDKPTDTVTKNQMTLKAQQVCDAFISDSDLWQWSDMANRDINWNGRQFKKGQMVEPDFKSAPTLEVYATALATWMAAIEYSGGGNKAGVKSKYSAALQKHINFLTTRAGWHEGNAAPQTLPEQIKNHMRAEYVPTSRFPNAQQACSIAEYSVDDFAREKKIAGNLTYVARSANDACNVPANLLNHSTPKEQALEQTYGLDVIALLAEKLTHLKTTGTIREQFIGTFDPVLVGGATLYGVQPDGAVMWFSDNITTRPPARNSGLTENITHKLSAPIQIKEDWNTPLAVLPGGASTMYVEYKNGDLYWYRHDSYLNGGKKWQGPTKVGTGWTTFTKIIPMGDGLLYGIMPDGTLRWNKHNNFKSGQGFYAGWAQPAVDVMTGFNKYKMVFGGGDGIFYAVGKDNKLYWLRHDYRHPFAVPKRGSGMSDAVVTALTSKWAKTWQGPKEIGAGWGDFTKLFCAGNGHIYGVLPSGELRGYDHTGWQDGSAKWGNMQIIAGGWNKYKFAFAAMPSHAAGDDIVVK